MRTINLRPRISLAKAFFAVILLASLPACSGGGGTTKDSMPSPSPQPGPIDELPPDSVNENCAFDTSEILVGTAITRIEAENYDSCATSFSDVSEGNDGGAYREQDVDILAHSAASNGHFVADMEVDEYLEYSIDAVRSGLFDVIYHTKPGATSAVGFVLNSNGAPIDGSEIEIAGATQGWGDFTRKVYLSDGPQTLRLKVTGSGAALDYIELVYTEETDIQAYAAVAEMGVGINLGNTLDAPYEGDWAAPAQKHYFADYKTAGFHHVRIPATWDNHTADTAPYTVDAARMDRTEQIVDWALAQGHYVILNAHHETWLKDDANNSAYQDRFEAIWAQIVERFKDKSSRLIFEILNEPQDMTVVQVNELNQRILNIIRADNPTRLVIFSGTGFTPIDSLLAADIPEDMSGNDYLIGNFHSYDPWEFAGQCTRTWGSSSDIAALTDIYQRAKSWSTEHKIPVTVNEFGVAHYDFEQPDNICDQGSRLLYFQSHVRLAIENGLAATVWDDGGSFVIYERETGIWRPAKDILVNANP